MEILSVSDPVFKFYGKTLSGYDMTGLIEAANTIEMPPKGTAHRAGIENLESCAVFAQLRDNAHGGMPLQLGLCGRDLDVTD